MKNYILEGKTIKEVTDFTEWAKWYKTANRHVDKTDITNKIKVSTVFLGIDHAFGGGEPVLFETMVFGGKHDEYQERYKTWEEAEAGHKRIVKMCKK